MAVLRPNVGRHEVNILLISTVYHKDGAVAAKMNYGVIGIIAFIFPVAVSMSGVRFTDMRGEVGSTLTI